MDPPNGRMTCSGLVTNETCSFMCDDGYEILGSKIRTCLNSSKWDGQPTVCKGKYNMSYVRLTKRYVSKVRRFVQARSHQTSLENSG